jgi:hypothetical protein
MLFLINTARLTDNFLLNCLEINRHISRNKKNLKATYGLFNAIKKGYIYISLIRLRNWLCFLSRHIPAVGLLYWSPFFCSLFGEHMIRKKVYIAGPMSGLPDCNRPAFNLAAQVQKSLTHIVLNPATLPVGLSEPEYMQIGLTMLMCADMIYLLNGWE